MTAGMGPAIVLRQEHNFTFCVNCGLVRETKEHRALRRRHRYYLLNLLTVFQRHPALGDRLALKGDTALNLFCFDLPRLSVDIDLNFMFRVPLWPVTPMASVDVGTYSASGIPVLDLHELADHIAGRRKMRSRELENQLLPVLISTVRESLQPGWAEQMAETCRERLSGLVQFTSEEAEFLDRLLDHGEIAPSLLTEDAEMTARIQDHPLLQWKALNVQRHRSGQ